MTTHDEQRRRHGSERRQRQSRVAARVDPEEGRLIQEAAQKAGMPVGAFVRSVVLAAAQRV